MHDARIVANEILRRAWDFGVDLSQIDIQKITYFLHGHHLLDHGTPLIGTEFQALHYGPVQTVLLESFRKWGDEPIRELATRFDPIRRTHHEMPRLTDNASMATIDRYLERYLEIPSFAMVEMTHSPGTPWSETMQRARNAVNIGMLITNEMISARFEGITSA
ncbi:MAG: DUF4065 domain-containing protein [Pseudorhodobacter sp.]|nr:DUF4065 domain-containing protein [Pseudorhodobacter sp.]